LQHAQQTLPPVGTDYTTALLKVRCESMIVKFLCD
jgi:hypothetical protein